MDIVSVFSLVYSVVGFTSPVPGGDIQDKLLIRYTWHFHLSTSPTSTFLPSKFATIGFTPEMPNEAVLITLSTCERASEKGP